MYSDDLFFKNHFRVNFDKTAPFIFTEHAIELTET